MDIPRAFDLLLIFPIEIATIPIQRTRSIVHSLSLDPKLYADSPRSSPVPIKELLISENAEEETIISQQPKPVLSPIGSHKTANSIASAISG